MAIDITDKIPSRDNLGNYKVDVSDKSLIKINSTSYNVFDNWSDFVMKYFGIDEGNNPYVTTLKSSFFGYFNELASSEIKNAVFHKNFLYDEHFLNTAVLPESIYNFAKLYNVPIEGATPATMYLKISISERELTTSTLLKEVTDEKVTNANANTLKIYNIVFSRENTLFTVGGYNFSLPYPIILTVQQFEEPDGSHSYAYSANYDTSNTFFPFTENLGKLPFLKVWKENIDEVDYVFIGFQAYQFEKEENSILITSTEANPDTLYHTFSFNNQIAFFEAKYEFNGKVADLNLYFNNIYTPSEKEYYAYYSFLNDNNFQLSFSTDLINGFRPVTGSTIRLYLYTTLGSKGNFDYSGGVTMKFSNNSSFNRLDFVCETMTDNSTGGKDRLDTYGQKTKILERITTRNNIITENDLLKFFDSVNESLNINGSTINFLKKQDDVIKRIYCNFLLLRDENKRVIPTNTAPYLNIKLDKGQTEYTIKEHSIVKCNYVRDIINYDPTDMDKDLVVDNFEDYFDKENNIRYSQDYIKYILDEDYFQKIIDKQKETYDLAFDNLSSIYELMKTFKIENDELVYTIPFMINIKTEPFLKATYYNMDINSEISLNYKYLNNKVGSSFNISTLTIYKDIEPSASNKYSLESNVYKLSFNLNSNLSYDDLKDKVVIKCYLMEKGNEQTIGHFFFKLKDVVTNHDTNVVSYDYKYEAELATDYSFNDEGKLNFYNCIYLDTQVGDTKKSILADKVAVSEDIQFQIGILLYDPKLAKTKVDKIDEELNIWYYDFPDGFIQFIEDPITIINLTESTDKEKENNLKSCYELTNGKIDDDGQSSMINYTEGKGYNNPESIAFLPVVLDALNTSGTDNSNYQFYEDAPFEFKDEYANSYGLLRTFHNENELRDCKITFTVKDTFNSDETNHLKLNGYLKVLIPDFKFETTGDTYTIEVGHKIFYDEAQTNFGNENNNITINKKFVVNEETNQKEKLITFTINSLTNILNDIDSSYVKLISYDKNSNAYKEPVYRRNVEVINMSGLLGYNILKHFVNMDEIAIMFYNITRSVGTDSTLANINDLTINSLTISRTDLDVENNADSRDNINNYILATILNNSTPVKLYQNMSSLMNSILTYDEKNDEYKLELVPMISLSYYMARPKMIYDLLNQFIEVVDSLLPRLENNTKCDMKFYNTYGPSRYFYFNKSYANKTVYLDAETGEEVDIDDENYNPYRNTIIENSKYTKYNYLGRTDIILDFTIYVNETVDDEKDAEIKKYISDYVEESNAELVLPISKLITLLQIKFPIIKYIKYNGIFSDRVDSNDSSKNNDYQLIDNDFDFNTMTKEEIRTYVPEYLNLKKSVIKENEKVISFNDNMFDIMKYSTYDYLINIHYKL